MRSCTAIFLCTIVGLLVAGCAGSGMSTSGTYRKTIGTTTRSTVRSTVRQILTSRYGYRFDRTITRSGYMRYLTTWQEHSVLSGEEKKGYTAARTRIKVTAQPRDRASGTYTARMEVKYSVQKKGSAEWIPVEIPSGRQEYIDDIYQDLSEELTTGVMAQ